MNCRTVQKESHTATRSSHPKLVSATTELMPTDRCRAAGEADGITATQHVPHPVGTFVAVTHIRVIPALDPTQGANVADRECLRI